MAAGAGALSVVLSEMVAAAGGGGTTGTEEVLRVAHPTFREIKNVNIE